MAHLKKISSLLSVYDALHMLPELRASMVYALTHPDEFTANDEITRGFWHTTTQEWLCMPAVIFEDTNRYFNDPHHNRPLFITSFIDNQPVLGVMIDGGLAVNILSAKTLDYLGVDPSQLRPNTLVIQGFNQNEQRPLDFVRLRKKFGHIEGWTSFYVIDVDTTYNALIGWPWMHKFQVVSSTYH